MPKTSHCTRPILTYPYLYAPSGSMSSGLAGWALGLGLGPLARMRLHAYYEIVKCNERVLIHNLVDDMSL